MAAELYLGSRGIPVLLFLGEGLEVSDHSKCEILIEELSEVL